MFLYFVLLLAYIFLSFYLGPLRISVFIKKKDCKSHPSEIKVSYSSFFPRLLEKFPTAVHFSIKLLLFSLPDSTNFHTEITSMYMERRDISYKFRFLKQFLNCY